MYLLVHFLRVLMKGEIRPSEASGLPANSVWEFRLFLIISLKRCEIHHCYSGPVGVHPEEGHKNDTVNGTLPLRRAG